MLVKANYLTILDILKRLEELENNKEVSINEEMERFFK